MSKRTIFFLLGIILILGIFLRFFALNTFPTGFHRDEAFFGYNAYSLYKTGKDMTGDFLPLHLASFLYTPSGYSYISIPFIAAFGLSEFSIRAASALFGSLTILITYFLCVELLTFFKKKEAETVGLISAFLLSISPWHINLSRTASAITVVVFFISLGVLFYLLSIRKNSILLLISSFLLWFVSLGFYIAPYSFLPLFLPLFYILFRKDAFVNKYKWLQLGLFIVLIIVPLIVTLRSPTLSLRASSLSITKTENIQSVAIEQIHADGQKGIRPLFTRFFHNKPFLLAQAVTTNYFHHFSFDFLFTDSGFPDRYRVPLVGLVYWYELPFLLLGLFTILKWNNKIGYFLLGWVLLAPVGSSLTYDDVPNLQRTLFMLPALTIIIAIGIMQWIKLFSGIKKQLAFGILAIIVASSVVFYIHQYYIHAAVYRPWYRQEGYKELVEEVDLLQNTYKKDVVTNSESAPTIFFLFYNKYNPTNFQKETAHTKMHDFDRIGFAHYEFSQQECPLQKKNLPDGSTMITGERGVLYVDSGLCKVPENARILKTIYRSDHSKAFLILDLMN